MRVDFVLGKPPEGLEASFTNFAIHAAQVPVWELEKWMNLCRVWYSGRGL